MVGGCLKVVSKSQIWLDFFPRAALCYPLRCTRQRREEFLVKAEQYYLNYLQTFFPDSFVAKVVAAWHGGGVTIMNAPQLVPIRCCLDQITVTLLLNIVQLKKPKSE